MVLVLLKISLFVFIAGNLLDMGVRLNPSDALKGLRDYKFVLHTLFWGFVVGPGLAVAITRIIPLEAPYAMGLILLGMAPSAPIVPIFVNKVRGDLGYAAAFMLLASVGSLIFMPFAVPWLVKGLTVSAWSIARPLLLLILIPLAVGMTIAKAYVKMADKMKLVLKKITGLFTIFTIILLVLVYGKGMLGLPGSFALVSQFILFFVLCTFPYWFGFGLKHEQKIVESIGMSTRNLGAAMAPLFSDSSIDQKAFLMVVLALPVMVLFAWLSMKIFGRRKPQEMGNYF